MEKFELLDVQANISQLGNIETNINLINEQAKNIKNWYTNLVITEEMTSDMKKEKAEINKAKTKVSEYRKNIVAEFNKPIDDFVKIAKEAETNLKEAYECINTQLAKYDEKVIQDKINEVTKYFNEYCLSLNIDFIKFNNSGIKVGLSNSLKSLKEQSKAFIDKVNNDLELIETQENKVEILAEYKKSLDVSKSILEVKQRIERERIEREKEELRQKAKVEREEIVQKVEEVIAPKKVIQEEELSMSFRVFGTIDTLRKVKNYLEKEGIKYESK